MTAPEILGGRYELRGVLGRGGMAEVRDGWDTRLNRAVAIKLIHPALGSQPETRTRFEAEARSAAGLNHPHIVAVHDSGEHNGIPFIVMERLSGFSLADQIARGPLPVPMAHKVVDDVLDALTAAHDAGVLHRDIKPGNILFTPSGEAKVTDFGIAKTAEAGVTMTGQIVGTMAYLSPDRLMGHPATPSDDLYAVGVVGYEALAGRRPFLPEHPGALARAIMDEQPPPLRALRPDVDPVLAAVIERAMARDPGLRFHNARAMRAALAGTMPVAAPGPPGPMGTRVLDTPVPPPSMVAVPPLRRSGPNRRKLWIGAAVAAILLAVMLAVFEAATSSSPPPQPATTSTPVTTTTTTPPTTTPPPTTVAPPVEQGPPFEKPGKKPKRNGNGRGGD
ncbi:serine/threonine-protein kinase [Mycobacterium sp. NPDC050551]|uniref:serine/threonine-protein kinase n=1 Tax=Mycobacterium sp. NPDC050551 TaxID=3155407 RepID=UPI003415A9CC